MVSENVVIDPSLLVSEQTMESTIKKPSREHEDLQFFLPQSFLDLVDSNQEFADEPGFQYFIGGIQNTPEYERLTHLLDVFSESITGYTVSEELAESYSDVYRALDEELPYYQDRHRFELSGFPRDDQVYYRENRDRLSDIVFEEFVFLVEESWIVSRTKNIFNTFTDAGAVTVQFGKRSVEQARAQLEHTQDAVIERMDKLKDDHDWQWVALGGGAVSPVLGLYFPAVGAATGVGTVAVQAYIKVFDP